jgi:hypothetical protein
MMSNAQPTDTHQKALSINLDPTIFGSFAEIGAGQEVARWFLQVGGASGTVAKTISAYDKVVSDDLYGAGTRYVSMPRLRAMLEREWQQLLAQLGASRGTTTKFFAFVDTVSARNFSGSNECHGWIGLRFQTDPQAPPNDVVLHINLQDRSNLAQQAAVGILGVNLIYAAYHNLSRSDEFLSEIAAQLSLKRVELDCMELSGPAFAGWDPRIVNASLVANELAEAVVFPAKQAAIPPTERFYKKAIVLAPSEFDHSNDVNGKRIEATLAALPAPEVEQSKGALGVFCASRTAQFTVRDPLTAKQIVQHVDALQAFGKEVIIFREPELYKMGTFLSRFTKGHIHFAVGLQSLIRALQDNYDELEGTVLEGVARLFRANIKLCVFPMSAKEAAECHFANGWKWKEANGLIGVADIEPPEPLNSLYRYLVGSGLILPKNPIGV